MRFTSCLLPVTFLSVGVSAFYPYGISNVEESEPSGTDGDKRRFYPWIPGGSNGVEEDTVVTLDIKRVPKVRRENNYSSVMSREPTMSDSMAIHNDGNDYSYFSVVTFGSKGQEMWMLLDTGAANTWVMGSDCKTKACQIHNTFGREDSNTLTVTDDDWDVTYGTGSVSGVAVHDSMSFAGFNLTMKFGSATDTSDDFLSYPMDGILGLGLSKPNADLPTVMKAMTDEKILDKNIVGINLQRNSDGARDGQITFGAIDESKFSGDVTYTNVLPNNHKWEIPIGDTIVDGTPAKFKGKSALIDTGTSFMLLPREDAKLIHSLIPDAVEDGEENFKVPCSTTASVEISISGAKYTVSHKDYVGRADSTGNMCSSNIAGNQPFGEDQWLLGAVFLKNVYSIFDFDKEKIGFATRKYNDSPSPTSTSTITSTNGSSTSGPTSSITISPNIPSDSDPAGHGNPDDSDDPDGPVESDKPDVKDEGEGNSAPELPAPLASVVVFIFVTCSSWLMFI